MIATRPQPGDPFKALADPVRRRILELLSVHGVRLAGEIADWFPSISRPAVSRHLRVLRHAGLVRAEGVGREQRYRLDVEPLTRLRQSWFAQFADLEEAALKALKRAAESRDDAD